MLNMGDLKAKLVAMDHIRRARANPNALVAAGLRVSSTGDRDQLRALATLKQSWQPIAWNYRDLVGELRYALRFRANCVSRARFYVAEIQPGTDDEPLALELRNSKDDAVASRITLDDALCADAERELARLPLDDGFGFLGVWSENFDVAGECWLHGYINDLTGEEEWKIRSVSEIEPSADGSQVWLIDPAASSGRRKLDLSEEGKQELYRLWVPHPMQHYQADSPLRSCLDTLEDIVLGGREMRAAARSRIASNGTVFLPFGMVMPSGTKIEKDEHDPANNSFAADFTAAHLAPISNEGDAGAMMPVVVFGDKEDIAAVRHLRYDREESETLVEKIRFSLSRMASTIDVPPEIINGMGEVNHWTAWQIDASTAKHHVEPGVRLMADSITGVYLRAALRKLGYPPEQVAKVRVWFTLGNLTENPNRRDDAIAAADRGAIGMDTLRDALGFSDEDKPSPEELLTMVAMKQGLDAAWVAQVLAWSAERQEGGPLEGLPMPPAPGDTPGSPSGREGAPQTSIGRPDGGVPKTAPPGIAASAVPADLPATDLTTVPSGPDRGAYRLVYNDFSRLMEVERTIRSKLLTAADESIEDAIRRAGSRLRGKVSADRDLSLSVKEVPSYQLCAHLGRDQALALADLPFLLNEAFSGLEGVFLNLVTVGIAEVVSRVAKAMGVRDDARGKLAQNRMTAAMTGRISQGWSYLESAVRARAEKRLFGDQAPDDEVGEVSGTIVPPAVIRAALSIVGGLPETSGGVDEHGRSITGEPLGGLSNGDTVHDELVANGGIELGYTWVYGITPQARKFDPHWDLEGERFQNWRDARLFSGEAYGGRYAFVGPFFHPGDHNGCMCDYVPGWALPAYGAQVDELLRTPTASMAAIIALADDDDRAGRIGTTAQHERERWREVQALQSRFMKGDAA